MKPVRVAIRKMVELVLRCGDIDNRYSDNAAMLDGAKAHRKLQSESGDGYRKEVSLSFKTELAGIPVTLHGRADGVITDSDGNITVDEIKTTTLTLEQIYEQREMHLGQAKCYAVMLLRQMDKPPDKITVRLTYYQLETQELRRYEHLFTRNGLEEFFADILQKYGAWLKYERDWIQARDESARKLEFPFNQYRKGQRELAVAVYRAIERKKKLYAQAPTGIGKTMSALFPSIKAVGEGQAEKLFYLTAKTVTRTVAEDAARLMSGNGLRFKSLTLRAKEKICPQGEAACNPDYCAYAKGHYDRVNGALLDLLSGCDLITPDVITAYAGKHCVCPYELALDTAVWADLVICDYNHVFDPIVYLRRFFSDASGEYVFLIDEAHNLADRVRDMYTASLKKSDFNKLKAEIKEKNQAANMMRRSAGKVSSRLIEIRKSRNGEKAWAVAEQNTELAAAAAEFSAAAEEWLAFVRNDPHPLQNAVLELYFRVLEFLGVSEIYGGGYAAITELHQSDVRYTLFCLDPSKIIAERLGLAKSAILFSATLTPLHYYRETLGGTVADDMISLPSPFDKDRLLIAAHCGISTRYADRPDSVGPVAEAIRLAVSGKSGNYIAYFPSYEYLMQTLDAFRQKYPEVKTIVQQSGMSDDERADFLARFDVAACETMVGFCVMGGIFSEGIDLKGDRLIGSIIVGVGLPKLSLRQELIREYFDRKTGSGYDYAYVFPGMNKVLQAAGRVIRSEEDFGLVLLIDSRFHDKKYRALFPGHWSQIKMIYDLNSLKSILFTFPFLNF